MGEALKKILKDVSTGIDGKTYCYARCTGHLAVLAYIALSVSDFVVTKQFNFLSFGTGFATIIGSVGGTIWAKQDTEPKG